MLTSHQTHLRLRQQPRAEPKRQRRRNRLEKLSPQRQCPSGMSVDSWCPSLRLQNNPTFEQPNCQQLNLATSLNLAKPTERHLQAAKRPAKTGCQLYLETEEWVSG